MNWHNNLSPHNKRVKRIIWYKFDIPWYWEQVKFEIKTRRYYKWIKSLQKKV